METEAPVLERSRLIPRAVILGEPTPGSRSAAMILVHRRLSMVGRHIVFVLVALVCSQSPAGAQDRSDLPAPLAARIAEARRACTDFEGGTLSVGWGAVRRVDLDGDLRPDWALDEAALACSSAASLFCGTGGCRTHFLVGDSVGSFLNRGWEVVTFGRDRVVLLDVHGSSCGGINPTPCVNAVVWDGETGTWRTVQSPPAP